MGADSIKGILFDLDGTLLDTLDDIADSMNFVLQKQRYPVHSVESYRRFVGDGVDTLVRRVLPLPENQLDDATVKRVADAFRKRYQANLNVKTKPYEGINEMFDVLQGKNLFCAVLSNKPHMVTAEAVRHYFGTRHFTVCMGQGIFPGKPDPQAALYIASSMGIPPEQCLYVGDTGSDMQTAAAAGMPSAGVLWGFRDGEELKANGARWIVSRPAEVVDIVENGVLTESASSGGF